MRASDVNNATLLARAKRCEQGKAEHRTFVHTFKRGEAPRHPEGARRSSTRGGYPGEGPSPSPLAPRTQARERHPGTRAAPRHAAGRTGQAPRGGATQATQARGRLDRTGTQGRQPRAGNPRAGWSDPFPRPDARRRWGLVWSGLVWPGLVWSGLVWPGRLVGWPGRSRELGQGTQGERWQLSQGESTGDGAGYPRLLRCSSMGLL